MNDQFRNRILNLSPDELRLAYVKLSKSISDGRIVENNENTKHLVAYVLSKPGFNLEKLQLDLKDHLPTYMIPNVIIPIKEIPKLPNGKVDIKSLRQKREVGSKELRVNKPKNVIEEELVSIWEEVLDFNPVSTQDNFFEIGGDSILSIQIIAKARKKGIVLSPNQLFEHQTISEIALFADISTNYDSSQNVQGSLEIFPIQHWFFDLHKIAPHFWNQILKVTRAKNITYDQLGKIMFALISHHDGLRSSFGKKSDNNWSATISMSDKKDCCYYFDVGNILLIQDQDHEIIQYIKTNQELCNLKEGKLFRALYFDCGSVQENKIYIIAHHLIVDMVSWNIITNDFVTVLDQIEQGNSINLEHKTASIKAWGSHVVELAQSHEIQNEIEYWNTQRMRLQLPKDFSCNDSFLDECSFVTHKSILSENDTSVLVNQANASFNTKVEDLLLTALVKTICEWSNTKQLHLGIERHGRTSDLTSLDVSNTVGWFTSFFPLTLKNSTNDLGKLIKSTKEKIREVPNDGLGYGILKYISKSWGENAELKRDPDLIFNYLGRVSKKMDVATVKFESVIQGTRHPLSERSSGLEINAIIENEKLIVKWSYSSTVFKDSTINLLADNFNYNLKNILAVCLEQSSAGYTPSDFPEAGLSQSDLDSLMDNL